MKARPHATAVFLTLALAAPCVAADSGSFVIRLGRDTTALERYTRTPSRLEVEQLGLAPRVLWRRFTYDYAAGEIAAFTMVVTPPGAPAPTQRIRATFGADSARVHVESANASPQDVAVAFPRGTLVATVSSPWASYEGLLKTFVKEKRDSLRTTVFFVGGGAPGWISLRRLGPDSVAIFNQRQDQLHVRVGRDGRLLGVLPVAGTAKVSVERVADLDLPALATAFAAREKAGGGLGTLSPRDSVVTSVGGASLWIDYGRPAKRGRVVFGGVVPYGEVWRTGANAATQFRTDRALDFGGTVVPAGFYSLWTIPGPDGWKLIVNAETGQWGTARKADKDLYTIDMKVSGLPEPVERFTISLEGSAEGGVLHLDWDTSRASASFTVRP